MEIITSFIFAFIATMAFAVLFQSPKKILLTDGLIGAVGWVVDEGTLTSSLLIFAYI